jgi:hypothetical protein
MSIKSAKMSAPTRTVFLALIHMTLQGGEAENEKLLRGFLALATDESLLLCSKP